MFHFELNESEVFLQDESTDNTCVTIRLEEDDASSTCPHCYAKMYRHGYYTRRLKDMPTSPNKACVVIVKARRYRCPVCGHTMCQEILIVIQVPISPSVLQLGSKLFCLPNSLSYRLLVSLIFSGTLFARSKTSRLTEH